MAPGDDYSPAEIGRALIRIEGEIAGIKTDISNLSFVDQNVWLAERDRLYDHIAAVEAAARNERTGMSADIDRNTSAIEKINGRTDWLRNTIAAALIGAVVVFIFANYVQVPT